MTTHPPAPAPRLPRAGDVLELGPAASVQFRRPILFRVIRALDWPTYHGWCWLEGYQLNPAGDAVARRQVYVQPAGLRYTTAPTPPRRPARNKRPTTAGGRPRNTPPRQPAPRPNTTTHTADPH